MPVHNETNPYFGPDQHSRSPTPGVATPHHPDQQSQLPGVGSQPHRPDHQNRPWVTAPWHQDQQNQPLGSSVSQPRHEDQHGPLETGPWQPQTESNPWSRVPRQTPGSPRETQPLRRDQRTPQPSTPVPRTKRPKRQDRRNQPMVAGALLPEHRDQDIQPSGLQAPKAKEELPQQRGQHPQAQSSPVPRSQHPRSQSPQEHRGQQPQPERQGVAFTQQSGRHGVQVPSPRRTRLITWFLAGFCAIFWIVIILGGLIVLIIYLLFRPHSPQFDVSGVTLNAAYLDMDVLLNADLTVLANFSNPNKKVRVDFSYVVLDLYYGSTLIASQYVEPFSATRNEHRLLDVHLVISQVRLPVGEIQRLKKEISKNEVVFKIKGVFRARSNLGSVLRYSYRLYGTCQVMVNGPPSGVIRAKKCKTKR